MVFRTGHKSLLCLLACVCLIVGCSDDAPSGTPGTEVRFADPELQACYERALRDNSVGVLAEEIEVLRCDFFDIHDLSGIGVLSGLLQMELEFNVNLQDLSPLLTLARLDTLKLSASERTNSDLDVISQIDTLEHLRLSGNELGNISKLSGLSNLRYLYLTSAGVTAGMRSLAMLSRLRVLAVGGNSGSPCADIEFLNEELDIVDLVPDAVDFEPGTDCAP